MGRSYDAPAPDALHTIGTSEDIDFEGEGEILRMAEKPAEGARMFEIDDDGRAILRFGDGVNGRDPPGQEFEIAYRVGNGSAGNVGADRIVQVLQTRIDPDGNEQVSSLPGAHGRNPLPASGGTDQEDVQQVKLLAPSAIQTDLLRAITPEDYAKLAEQLEPEVQRAACSLSPSGGRQVARMPVPGNVHIGDRCWLGARAMIMPGVTIGDGTIIGAGSVVTKDCEPDALYVGVPAHRVR